MSDSTTLVYKKKKKKFKIFPLVNAIFFIIVACLIMIPIYRVIISSFDANTSYNFVWLPSKFTWGGYTAVLTRSSLYTPFLISVVTTIIGTFVGLLVVTWWLCINSVGDARKKLLCLYASLHNDFRWWYDS